jgi:SAM-dependent methyltransferase
LNLPDQSADCAVSLYAFRHFPNPAKAMQELFRVLKPGGQVIVAVGSAPKLFSVDGVRAAISAPIRMLAEKSGRRRTACGHLEAFAQLHLPDTYKDTVAPWTEHHHGFSDSIESLVTQAGFHLQSREWKGAKYKIDSIDEYWNLQATFSSVARKKISAASANDVIKLKNFFYDDCRKVQNAGGALVYEVGAAVIRAKK